MNYKEKYEQALQRMKDWVEGKYPECQIEPQQIAELVFPELKENEDEKIRKALVEHCKEQADIYKTLQTAKEYGEIQSWIAWLEKQGEYKTNYCKPEVDLSNCSEEYRKAYYDGYNKCNHDWQRQGEQKQPKELTNSEFVEKCKGLSRLEQHILALVPTRPIDAIKVDARTVRYLVEQEQGEQKHADKIEPKFNVGDWITDGNITIQIEAIKNGCYLYCGNCALYSTKTADKVYHLWTIQDAKDGDILHSIGFHSDCVFIFNGLDNWKFDAPDGERVVATGYCCLSASADKMEFGIQGPDCIEVDTVKPATKIQRDLLFAKMREAGYEWDAESKEVKKVEQIHVWSDKDLIDLGYLAYFVDQNGDKFYGKNKPNVVKWIYSLANRTTPQQEWSEEDKRNLDWLITVCERIHYKSDPQVSPKSALILRDWLKFLKDRVQSKQEWSEKDEIGFGDATWAIKQARTIAKDENDMGNLWYAEYWLKSLKDRYSWKPSEEQMDCLNSILRFGNVSQTSYKHLNSLINDLKKLKG